MDRLCTECSGKIKDDQDVRFMKVNHTGDLCKKCWDNEWEKCKLQAREDNKGIIYEVII